MKNFTMPLSSKISAGLVTLATACGSSQTVQQNVASEGPSGRVFSDKIEYYDGAPSISANGQRLAFESGRQGATLRIFKLEMPADPATGTPGEAMRLTPNDDLNSETVPKIASDGTFVNFLANNESGVRSLYKSDWGGAAPAKFSADGDQVFSHGISADDQFFVYAAHDPSTDRVKVVLVSASDASNTATLNSGARNITGFTWLEGSGGSYKIATVATVDESGLSQIKVETWSFTGTGDFGAATVANLTTNLVPAAADNLENWLVPAGAKVFAVQPRTPGNDRSVGELGAGAIADRQIFARSDLLIVNSGSETTSDQPLGQSLAGVSSTDDAIVVQANETTRCVADDSSTQIISFKLAATTNAATAASYERMLVRKTSAGMTYDLVSDPCETSGEGVTLDTTPGESVLSADSTATDLTLAYVSVVTGDPEIVVIRKTAGTTKVWNVSANPVAE